MNSRNACRVCGELFTSKDVMVSITRTHADERIHFHTDCFKELAGDAYIPETKHGSMTEWLTDVPKYKPLMMASEADINKYAQTQVHHFFGSGKSFVEIQGEIYADLKSKIPVGIGVRVKITGPHQARGHVYFNRVEINYLGTPGGGYETITEVPVI